MPLPSQSRGKEDPRLAVVTASLHCLCFQDPATPRVSPAHSPPENGLDKARGLKKDAPTSPASVASSSSTPSSKTKDLGHVCGVCPGILRCGEGVHGKWRCARVRAAVVAVGGQGAAGREYNSGGLAPGLNPDLVGHGGYACNPSYSGGREREV
jgi:hypothetical protein